MSGGSNQRTLFQTWGASVSQNKAVQSGKDARKATGAIGTSSSRAQVAPTNPPPHQQKSPWTVIGQNSTHTAVRQEDIIPEDEDDDDLMVVAVYEAERSLQLEKSDIIQNNHATGQSVAPFSSPTCRKIYPDLPGFDSSSADVWIYPTNYPIRDYQLKMSEASLFQNTLVCLPTGLGKTFIASVVMYNFYRWYPAGKIVFMAPTKPLVAQQIEACYKVMGIPQDHMAELTGSTAAKQRQEVWKSKRVFFLTPQVMVNDLSRETCPAKEIKCVVIDEAHKALGNHAYCQVIRQLSSQTLQFRVLALSATPGGDTKSVQSVISNLLISHIELRSEESPDIQAHSHQRSVEKVVVPLGEKLSGHQARYLQVLERFMSRLVQNRVMGHKDLRALSKYQLILARDQFRKNPPPHIKGSHQGVLEGDFALCISLYHGYELLIQMGLRSLFFYLQGIMDGSREMSRAKNELQRTPTFMDLYQEMETMFLTPPDGPFIYSHPKLEKLEEVVLQHFNVWVQSSAETNDGVSTRVMIFSSFRESVQEIASMLNRHAPLIRVMTFMGQASAGKGVKGFTQKEQLEVVHRFRQGGFNTLVSTCVGEEGLDIGEVDLIVCFDSQKNPIRLVQRMGRTGRKRQGRIVVILTEGREERTYNQSQSNKRSVYKSITGNRNGFRMYPSSPRMLPEGMNPQLHKIHITSGQFDHKESRRSIRGRRSHTAGRTSLIHPQNLIRQESPTSDGFLSRAEYSLWSSTMRLEEHEAHPTLKLSHFMSIPSDSTPQEATSRDKPPSRELSLWEWRHWQHKLLPFHAVDHSLRCRHFSAVMQLIDGMRDESEGECLYEQQLLPYLQSDYADAKRQKKPKAPKNCSKTNKSKTSHSSRSELKYIDEEAEMEDAASRLIPEKQRLPDERLTDDLNPDQADSPSHSSDDDCVIVNQTFRDPANPGDVPEVNTKNNEDDDLQEMFYLPKTYPALLSPKTLKNQNDILVNVAELLSRSPPSPENILEAGRTLTCLPPSPELGDQPFPVRFSLEVDDDDDVEAGIEDGEPRSPTWDEVFEDENIRYDKKEMDLKSVDDAEERVSMDADCVSEDRVHVQMDESMDLFEDDEAFMQMTIPDIPTPEDSITAKTTINDEGIEKISKDEDKDCTEILNVVNKAPFSGTRLNIQTSHNSTEDHYNKVSFLVKANPEPLDSSHDLFSVNFDLGYSLEDSEDEAEVEVALPSPKKQAESAVSNSSTPRRSFARLFKESKSSSQIKTDYWKSKTEELPSPVTLLGPRQMLLSRIAEPDSSRAKQKQAEGDSLQELIHVGESSPHPECCSDSEEEVVLLKRRHHKVNPLSSPEVSKGLSDVDSPVVAKKKRSSVLNTTDETQAGDFLDDDFQNCSIFMRRKTTTGAKRQQIQQSSNKNPRGQKARQFLDEEAELSEDEEDVSSDEEDGADLNRSLEGFVVDNMHLSQGLNDSEMHGVYLKSVRSPAVRGKFKMSYKSHQNMDIFSQVPEMDETYAEDSFVVGSDEEEEESNEEEPEDVELLPDVSLINGRRQYATRRRIFLHKARAGLETNARTRPAAEQRTRTKRSRVVCLTESSEEETEEVGKNQNPDPSRRKTVSSAVASVASKVSLLSKEQSEEQQNERRRQRLENQHLLSDELDFAEQEPTLITGLPSTSSAAQGSAPQDPVPAVTEPPPPPLPGSVSILVDSRCTGGMVELVMSLRQRHGADVHVCSLDSNYSIVSNRMAVMRQSQSDLAAMQNRKRLAERLSNMQELFERVCLIVEKDRSKQGEVSRPFQRTRYYDNTLAALFRAGVRLLWSDGAEESAGLLVDLAKLERRKGQGIAVPLKVKGQRREQALQMYLSLPSVSHVHALNLLHNFSCVAQLMNGSVESIQKGGCMSRSRAEEIYRFLRRSCDSAHFTKTPKAGKNG
ncbi:Fanconi anemia group M protein isoform X2 [Xiphophorus couchianus]|uniref:Fanconi anemia group M protein isoform X2 n=1 Tax=Xiphophorus couchianus TaxID=32473 RepID=UPI0010169BF0|nr:Fanconi anemia group M protein isoform X2 [Xiphophorus couchianus]